jgi:class 3 adenylate cyclase
MHPQVVSSAEVQPTFMLGNLSIRSKLLILLLLSGIGGSIILGTIGYVSSSNALSDAIYKQLTSIRETRKAEVERYMTGVQDAFALFANQDHLGDAVDQLKLAFDASGEVLSSEQQARLSGHYEQSLLPWLADLTGRQHLLSDYLPQSNPGKQLQYQYIAANKHGDDRKQQLLRPPDADPSRDVYARIHERLHPEMLKVVEKLNLSDIYLIDHRTGNVLYSISKKPDFATNLKTGPYRRTALAGIFETVLSDINIDRPVFSDFEKYPPAGMEPVAFIAMPVFRRGDLLGVVAGRTSSDILNATLTSGGKWVEQGLDQSGEVYVVGSDLRLRTDSRFYLEDREGYLQQLEKSGVPELDRRSITVLRSTVLNQIVDTVAVRNALAGKSGTEIVIDYRGVPVLSAYAPLNIGNLRWAIMAEKDVAEALQPMHDLRRNILLATGSIAIALTLFSLLAANSFLRPINRLKEGVEGLAAGDDTTQIPVSGNDEFAALGNAFNSMVQDIADRNQTIRSKTLEYESLLRSVLPDAVASRVSVGETLVADTFENVTAIYAAIDGFASVMRRVDAGEMIRLMNELVDGFDEAAERHGIEKIKTVGDVYLAACGLPAPRLDHSQRAHDFASEMIVIMERFNKANGLALTLRIGLDSGEVDAGIVGRRRFVYEIFGECVVGARQLALAESAESVIRLSDRVRSSISAGIEAAQ